MELRVRAVGSGPPLVLVHGLSGSSAWWRRNVPALARRRRVHLVDLPRRGRLADAPAALAELLRALERPSLVGHSLGGFVCVRAAALEPDALERLVLVAPAGAWGVRSRLAYTLPIARTAVAMRPALALRIAFDAARTGAPALWRTAGELLQEDVRRDLRAVRVPTLLVWGDHDLLVPRGTAEEFLRELPDARLVVIRGAGHVPMWDRPDEFAGAVLDFV